jgi:hypothetical protein
LADYFALVQIIAVIRSLLRVTRRPDKAGHVLLFDQNENARPAFSLLILKAKFLSLNQTQNLSLYLTQQTDHQNYFLRRSRSYFNRQNSQLFNQRIPYGQREIQYYRVFFFF